LAVVAINAVAPINLSLKKEIKMSNLDYVNAETGTVNIQVFDQIRAGLAELKVRYTDVPDCSTAEGYALAKTGKNVLTKYRTKLEAKRKEIKKPYQDNAALIDSDAKGIRLALEAIENPIKGALKIADEAEAKKKADRIARLQAKVDNIYDLEPKAHATEGTEAVVEIIEFLTNLDVYNDYYDLTTEAQDAKAIVLDRLGNLLSQRLGAQVAEAQRLDAEERSRVAEAESKQLREDMRKMQEAAALAQPEPVVELEDVVEVEQVHANTYTTPIHNIEAYIEPSGVIHELIEEPTKLMVWADSWDIDGECFRQLLEIIECEK
jgi:hypothetical protein